MIRGQAFRVTVLDNCGVPLVGPKSTFVSDQFISVKLTPDSIDGEDTAQKNAAGKLCVVDKAPDILKNVKAEITFCKVDPELISATTGQELIVDWEGNPSGVAFGDQADVNWALEVWADIPGTACGSGGKPYGYHLLPLFPAAKLGEWTIEEKLASFSITATTLIGNGWGVGPYKVTMNPGATEQDPPVPGPLLLPLSPDKQLFLDRVTVPPPTPVCGSAALPAA
jgi:hypothetical protein